MLAKYTDAQFEAEIKPEKVRMLHGGFHLLHTAQQARRAGLWKNRRHDDSWSVELKAEAAWADLAVAQ